MILTWREHPFIINEDRLCLEIAEITFCGLAAEDYFLRKDSFDTDKMEDKRHEESWYFYGSGCEEIEGLTVVDIVRRAKLEMTTISITDKKK